MSRHRVQGQVIYRVAEPPHTAALLNFALDAKGRYVSDDPQKLAQRVIDQVQWRCGRSCRGCR